MTTEEFVAGNGEVAPPGPDDQWQTLTAETNPAQPEKKRRGRPPKDPNAPPKPRATTRARGSIKDQIGATLFMFNLAFQFMPEPWKSDALDDVEIVALADALDKSAKTNPVLHKMLSTVLVDGGAIAELVMVAGMVAGRRLARHHVIDENMDGMLGGFLSAKVGVPVPDANPVA